MLKAFLKDSVIYAVPSFISRGLSLLLIPLYTRVLKPADYGALDLLTVFAGIVNLTLALEVSQGVARFFSEEKNQQVRIGYASSAFWFTLGCYLIFLVVSLFFTDQLAPLIMGQAGLELPFRIGLIYIFFNGLMYFIQNQLRWELRSKSFAALSLVYTLITAASCIWLTFFMEWGLVGFLWGMVFGAFSASILGLWFLRKSIQPRLNRELLKVMLQFSTPLVPASLAVWVSSYIDRIMITHFLSLNEVGLYGIGFRLSSIIALVMAGFQAALTPLVYTHHQNSDTPRQLAKIFRLGVAVSLLLFSGINLFVMDILKVFAQPNYYDSSQVVIFLVPAILFSQLYIFTPGIFIAKKTYLVVWINVIGAIANAGLNFLLIPLMGYTGAGLATLLGNLSVFGFYFVASQKFYYVPHSWKQLSGASILVVMSVLLFKWLDPIGWFHYFIAILGLVFCFLIIVVFGLIRKEEISLSIKTFMN